ncbi:Zn(2)-C6 fungal-type domain-containing protein [Mycena indigotica]|uniref:Zn(2)-C6 fungal-type domain-containing protein n=1 Tax=Mycena indigotica TaxID=2126181 RepID=A0A8H6SQ56_9AGAR|nr:Zn(2)-C6 fungal-type domain-containing protein [Mycena indigotica]KAF7303965.1 Zn(2)-C6 fungal-type domain-containing protein [Mycena indigotica]
MPQDLQILLAAIYSSQNRSPHAIAVLFFVFAHAALVDLALPAYNTLADAFFDAGRVALALESIFEGADVRTAQALALAGLYHATGGPRYSTDSSWTMTSMAMLIAMRLKLHRENTHQESELEFGDMRRALFWELYSLDTYQALSFSRPLSISASEVDCEFPKDKESSVSSDGQTVPGFYQTKWRFTKEITAPIAMTYSKASSPKYEQVMEMDRKLRRFIEVTRETMMHYATEASPTQPSQSNRPLYFRTYIRVNLIPRFCGNLLLYIHRTAFVQALKDNPDNPLDSPFASSFLAAYRGALMIVKSDSLSFEIFPARFHRWWVIYKSLSNAAFILGSIACKAPKMDFASTALRSLDQALANLEIGARQSFLVKGFLPSLQRLRNTAALTLDMQDSGLPSQAHLDVGDLADENDFELLAGSRAVLRPRTVVEPAKLSLVTETMPHIHNNLGWMQQPLDMRLHSHLIPDPYVQPNVGGQFASDPVSLLPEMMVLDWSTFLET